MVRLARLSLLLALLLLAATQVRAGQGGTRYAFLVGCSEYRPTEFRQLPYTGNDVNGFRDALLQTGFDADNIIVMHDSVKERRYVPEKAKILQELDFLIDGMRPQDTLIVALSGHGLQYKGDKINYFVPVDGKIADKKSLIPLDGPGGLYEKIKACKAKKKLMIVNACRNDPTVSLDFAANQIPLADEDTDDVPEGIAAIFSCSKGQKSYYVPERKMAIFYEHVIKAWKGEYSTDGKTTLETFLRAVTVKTKMDANKTLGVAQLPDVKRDYKGEWVIAAAPPPPRKNNDLEAGRKLLSAGQPEQALALLEKAVSAAPDSAAARTARGTAYLRTGKFAQARTDLQEALRLDRQDAEAACQLGWISYYGFGLSPPDPGEAMRSFRLAADRGHGEAMAAIGQIYHLGFGVTRDDREALSWFKKAADKGDGAGTYGLGLMFLVGWGTAKDTTQADVLLKKALPALQASADRPYARYLLGNVYEYGDGVPRDYSQAMTWYRKATDVFEPAAMGNLGVMYEAARGTTRDYYGAFNWYRKAAELGDRAGMYRLAGAYENGRGTTRDYYLAMQWHRKAADLGEPGAMTSVGWLYENGYGVQRDYGQALSWYQKGAAQNEPYALNNIGAMYENGRGVSQNHSEAFQWYTKAANLGNALAMNNLGRLYEDGHGVSQDYAQAAKWFKMSAERGNVRAMNSLGWLYDNGNGVPKDLSEAARWYRKSAEGGYALAMTNLGWALEKGRGVDTDAPAAAEWYKKAAALNEPQGTLNLGLLYEYGRGVPKSYEESFRYYKRAAELGLHWGMHNLALQYEYGRGVAQNTQEAIRWYRMAAQKGNDRAREALQRLGAN